MMSIFEILLGAYVLRRAATASTRSFVRILFFTAIFAFLRYTFCIWIWAFVFAGAKVAIEGDGLNDNLKRVNAALHLQSQISNSTATISNVTNTNIESDWIPVQWKCTDTETLVKNGKVLGVLQRPVILQVIVDTLNAHSSKLYNVDIIFGTIQPLSNNYNITNCERTEWAASSDIESFTNSYVIWTMITPYGAANASEYNWLKMPSIPTTNQDVSDPW